MPHATFEQMRQPEYWGDAPYEPVPPLPGMATRALGVAGMSKSVDKMFRTLTNGTTAMRYELIEPGEEIVPPVGHKSHLVRVVLDKHLVYARSFSGLAEAFGPEEFDARAMQMAKERWYSGPAAAGIYEDSQGTHLIMRQLLYGQPVRQRWGLAARQSFEAGTKSKSPIQIMPSFEVGKIYQDTRTNAGYASGLYRVSAETVQSIGEANKSPSLDFMAKAREAGRLLVPQAIQ